MQNMNNKDSELYNWYTRELHTWILHDLQDWMHYVNGWMSFWNMVDLACFGAVFCWLIYLTIAMVRVKK